MGTLGLWKPGLARQDSWGGGRATSGLGALQGAKAGQASVGWSGVGGVQGPYPSGHQLFFPHPSPHLWPLGQTYYGQVLKKSADLQTNACVTAARPVPQHIREALQNVHEEVSLRYYGCGLVIPECLENCWILDLGSGSGRDCYALSQLVGEKGHVTGIDMTEGQVEVANKYIEYHMEKYGFQAPNVNFIHGYIEKLEEAGIKNESYDIVISNCVINLVPDKQQVLQEVYRVLKHGGELYFSDVYASLELPEEIRTHKVLWGECLGGALYWKDLFILAKKIGFCPPRLVTANFITVQNKDLENVIGDCCFVSATFRLFKLPKTGPTKKCQVIYNGGITGHEKELIFDANFTFKDMITDPFELAGRSDSAESRSSPAVGGCCSTKKCS
nr:arsenite methyltransferase isoform X2 [Odocoileus virginianus texanus]